MRVVSLVPSITETLIRCGVEVVGRTRYCIHPREVIQKIPPIGGTKDLNLDELKKLKPDLLILDKEENLKWMKDKAPCEVLTSHVVSLQTAKDFIKVLYQTLKKPELQMLYQRWCRVVEAPNKVWNWNQIPASSFSWSNQNLEYSLSEKNVNSQTQLHYLIWRNPWMTVSRTTYIGDVLTKLGAGPWLKIHSKNYPEVVESELLSPDSVCLFSSEPYPFARYKKHLPTWAFHGAVVDGECYSWFGIRSLEFLERQLFENPD